MLNNKIVLLDPGHGGYQLGAVVGSDKEKDINLDYTFSLSAKLRQKGFTVIFTRDCDISLSLADRLRIIEEAQPSAFISIHCNAIDVPSVHGSEIYFRDEFDLPLAKDLQKGLEKTDIGCRGAYRDIERLNKRLTVLNNLQIPCVLIELGYMTNDGDKQKLKESKVAITELIASSIAAFYHTESENLNG